MIIQGCSFGVEVVCTNLRLSLLTFSLSGFSLAFAFPFAFVGAYLIMLSGCYILSVFFTLFLLVGLAENFFQLAAKCSKLVSGYLGVHNCV